MWEGSLPEIILGPKRGVGKLISYFKNIANAFLMPSCVLKGKKASDSMVCTQGL